MGIDEAVRRIKGLKLERSELIEQVKELEDEIAGQCKEYDEIKKRLDEAQERIIEFETQ